MAPGRQKHKSENRQHPEPVVAHSAPENKVFGRMPPLRLLTFFLIAALGIIIYAHTLHAPFVFDDEPNIVLNRHIRMTEITADQVLRVQNSPSERPFANLSFALNYFFHQYQPAGYRVVNILVHIINALLVFFITLQTMRLCRGRTIFPAALLASLVWLVHPLHIQSVTYIVQRMNSLAALFYLLALFCYVKARSIPAGIPYSSLKKGLLFLTVVLSGGLGLASKPTAATLPIILFLYEWFFFQDLKVEWLRKNLARIILPGMAFLAIVFLYLGTDPMNAVLATYEKQEFSMGQRLLTEPLVMLYYLSLLIFPHPSRLHLDYSFPLSRSLLIPPITVLGLITLLVLLTMTIRLARTHRLAAFAILWFLITQVIESSFVGLALVFEHRTYLPSVFLAIAAVDLLLIHLKNQYGLITVLAIIILVFGCWTYQRNYTWQNEITFWQDGVNKSPLNTRPHNNLGLALLNAGNLTRAEHHFRRSLALDPRYQKAHYNLGLTLFKAGDVAESEPHFRRALALDSLDSRAHNNLGEVLFRSGRIAEAEKHYRQALALDPYEARIHGNLGNLLSRKGEVDQAIDHYHQALALDPYFVEACNNLGVEYIYKGLPDQALANFQKALELDPEHRSARDNLQRLRKTLEQYGSTLKQRQRDVADRPADPDAHFALAQLYQHLNMQAAAFQHYQKVLALQPDHAASLDRLTRIYVSREKYEKAVECLNRLAALQPDNPEIAYGQARFYSRMGKKTEALESLQRAVQAGLNDRNRLLTDPYLQTIRDTDFFRQLTAESVSGKGQATPAQP